MNTIPQSYVNEINQMLSFNKALEGLEKQSEQHKMAIANISDLIKKFKANRNKKLKVIVGGNLIDEIDNREALKSLQDRRRELEIGLRGIQEQIAHREDAFESITIKIYNMFKGMVPEELKNGS